MKTWYIRVQVGHSFLLHINSIIIYIHLCVAVGLRSLPKCLTKIYLIKIRKKTELDHCNSIPPKDERIAIQVFTVKKVI